MAVNDLLPWLSADGGTHQVMQGRLKASESYLLGEPVYINAAGEISESGDDPDSPKFGGIAAHSADTTAATRNPKTRLVYAAGDLVSFWVFHIGDLIVCQNFATDGAGTAAAPLVANLGDEAGFTLSSGVYSIDVGTGSELVRIVDILNSRKEPVIQTGETLLSTDTFYVIAAVVATQFTAESGEAQAPAA